MLQEITKIKSSNHTEELDKALVDMNALFNTELSIILMADGDSLIVGNTTAKALFNTVSAILHLGVVNERKVIRMNTSTENNKRRGRKPGVKNKSKWIDPGDKEPQTNVQESSTPTVTKAPVGEDGLTDEEREAKERRLRRELAKTTDEHMSRDRAKDALIGLKASRKIDDEDEELNEEDDDNEGYDPMDDIKNDPEFADYFPKKYK